MNHLTPRPLISLVTSLAVLALAGCAAGPMRPLTSKPPTDKLVLSEPYSLAVSNGSPAPQSFVLVLPVGEYRPLFEDGTAIYYQAPAKVGVNLNEVDHLLFDGGVYWRRGSASPTGWYYLDSTQNGLLHHGWFITPFRQGIGRGPTGMQRLPAN
jgi:hypothetical protein